MKQFFALIFSILLTLTIASAAEIKTEPTSKHIYNYGDTISLTHIISTNDDLSAILKSKLTCGEYNLDFFSVPVDLHAGDSEKIETRALNLKKSMTGTCVITTELQTLENEPIAKTVSDSFIVSPDLEIDIKTIKSTYLPGENVEFTIEPISTYTPFKGNLVYNFENLKETIPITGKTTIKIPTDSKIKSGNHEIRAIIEDSNGNKGERIGIFNIEQVPTTIKISTNTQNVTPPMQIKYFASLLDQADEKINNKEVTTTLSNPSGIEITTKTDKSGTIIEQNFENNADPGIYTIKATGFGIEQTEQITVNEVKSIESAFDQRVISITNNGNVLYEKPINISLIKEGISTDIIKEAILTPKETIQIDLFKEMPSGTYTVLIPTTSKVDTYENVQIIDERPLSKKIGSFISPLTGNIAKGNTEGVVKTSIFALAAFFIIAFLTIGIVKIFNNNKKDDVEKTMRMQKEVDEANKMHDEMLTLKTKEPKQTTTVKVDQKTQTLRDDPDIRKFVDRVLREK